MPLEEITLAEVLKKEDYTTCHIGKWHLGEEPYYPEKQGFEYNVGGWHLGWPPSYFSPYKNPYIEDGPEGEYLTVFGQYILQPQIFDFLEEHIENNVRERGEFQLTSALDRLRREGGFLGLLMNGQRFDIGLPEHYLETLQTYSK